MMLISAQGEGAAPHEVSHSHSEWQEVDCEGRNKGLSSLPQNRHDFSCLRTHARLRRIRLILLMKSAIGQSLNESTLALLCRSGMNLAIASPRAKRIHELPCRKA